MINVAESQIRYFQYTFVNLYFKTAFWIYVLWVDWSFVWVYIAECYCV